MSRGSQNDGADRINPSPCQSTFLGDDTDMKIMEKSRRIGISWAMAHYPVLLAAETEGDDIFSIGNP